MKAIATLLSVAALSLAMVTSDAEAARRLGGGKSVGMQRDSASMQRTHPPASPAQQPAAQPSPSQAAPAAAAAGAPGKRSWMGPLAGLAAGLGLAALAAHFGFGEGLATALLIGLMVFAAIAVVGFVMRRRAASMQPAMEAAGRGTPWSPATRAQETTSSYASTQPVAASPSSAGRSVPADFDVDGFLRQAKVSFLRLQAAHDAGNLDDIREFTSPEMFGEIKTALMERGSVKQETDVVELHAELMEVDQDSSRHIVSVRFSGVARIDGGKEIESIDEVWHIVKPISGQSGWTLAGIQQLQ